MDVGKGIREIGVEDIVRAGLSPWEARSFYVSLMDAISRSPSGEADQIWRTITDARLLRPRHPHSLLQLVYYSTYHDWDVSQRGPPLYWFPSLDSSRQTNLGRVMETHGPNLMSHTYKDPIASFREFQQFSVEHPQVYWSLILKELSIIFHECPKHIIGASDRRKNAVTWLPGSTLNIAECCLSPVASLGKVDDGVAIVWRNEAEDEDPVKHMTLSELRSQVMRVANALDAIFSKGDAIAIDMPMTTTSVVVYLAIVLAGYVVVSVADSFAAKEIASRLRLSNSKGIFTQPLEAPLTPSSAWLFCHRRRLLPPPEIAACPPLSSPVPFWRPFDHLIVLFSTTAAVCQLLPLIAAECKLPLLIAADCTLPLLTINHVAVAVRCCLPVAATDYRALIAVSSVRRRCPCLPLVCRCCLACSGVVLPSVAA